MEQQIALYLKMISYYEQKLQTIKQTLYSNNQNNILQSFYFLSNNENYITKNTLLNFFVQNLHPINYKDIIEFIWFIGDKEKFIINQSQFQDYLTSIMLYKQNIIIEHSLNDLQIQLLKLLVQQIKVIKQIKDSKLQIINHDQFNIQNIFNELSNNTNIINCQTLLNFMKKQKIQFNNLDFDLLIYSIFGRKNTEIHLQLFKESFLFSDQITNKQQIKSREIPEETQMKHSYLINLSKSIIQQQQLMPISENSSIIEFKTSDIKPKTKKYQEITHIPRPY